MTINTNTGKLSLTKTEQALLEKSKSLLVKIAKHADGDTAGNADSAADALACTINCLNRVEEPAAA